LGFRRLGFRTVFVPPPFLAVLPEIPIMNSRSEKRNLDIPKDWQLTRRFRCPTCGKRYAVVEWKRAAKCRQCGDALYCEDLQSQPSGLAQGDSPGSR
jgi:predicted RNA-binding Zn-ribbon protein involved in translation (DUF1610 family)